jgi:hypothetical protein
MESLKMATEYCHQPLSSRGFPKVDWMPSALLAEAMVDLAALQPSPRRLQKLGMAPKFFNVRNPSITPSNALLPALENAYHGLSGKELDVASSSSWIEHLQESEKRHVFESAASITSNPAVKLLTFYRDGL